MLKRTIALLLCAVMVISMLPVQAVAQEIGEQTTVAEETGPAMAETDPGNETDPLEEVTEETDAPEVLVSSEETEAQVDTAVPAETSAPVQTEPVCTGLADCPGESHDDGCVKKQADEKAAADQAAADAVMVLIQALPTLEALQSKPMAEQQKDYAQVQAVYEDYSALTPDQQALLPAAEEVFKPYFDYFNSLVSLIWSGSGTSSSPFLIYTEQELRSLAQQIQSGNTYHGTCFKLAGSIALTGEWTPIGTEAYPFCGTFDGNGNTVSGLTASGDYIGLFGYVGSSAVIKNLSLTEISMTGAYYVAGLAAWVDAGTGSVFISNCHVSGTVCGEEEDSDGDEYGEYTGGIAAYVAATDGTVTIENCTMSGRCDGNSDVGGIVGCGEGSAQKLMLKNCINRASVPTGRNSNSCGGIAGSISNASVISCMNYGAVSGNAYSEENGSSWLGGIAGYATACAFTGCGNYGNVSTFFAGGISPAQYGNNVVDSCLNVGDMTHSSDGYGSALIYSGSAINSFYLTGTGSGITGSTAVSAAQLASGEVAHALREYFGQAIGEDTHPVPLTASNRVYKVSVTGEANGSFYVNYGGTVALPELSSCTAYFVGDSKFDPATPITRDYALAAKGYHNYVDGVCIYCGSEGVDYVDVGSCGESAAWILTADGVLKISGTGAMMNYSASDPAPWNSYLSAIQSVEIGEGVTCIGNHAFNGLTNVNSACIASTVTGIGQYAFYGMSGLTEITIGDSVTEVGDYAFACCGGARTLSLGKRLQTIGNYAFYQCTGLETVSIPASVTTLGSGAFRGCTGLNYVGLNSGLKTIGSYAWADTIIENIRIPATVTGIGDYAFGSCTALQQVTFLGSAPEIAATAFSGATVSCYTPAYDSSWESKVNKHYGGTLTWAIGGGRLTDTCLWVLDYDGVLTVSGTGDMYYFSGTSNIPWYSLKEKIRSAVISDGITAISDYSFSDCTNLQSVTIADSVTKIGTGGYTGYGYGFCFQDCTSLTEITIPRNITTIAYSSFYGCTSLTAIHVASGNTAFSSTDGILYDRYQYTLYCYPAGKTGDFTIPSGVQTIEAYAFATCKNLTEVTIPTSVTVVGTYAFASCKALNHITFTGSAPTIVRDAFSNVTATVDYPGTDTTWTADKLQNYYGTLTWNAGSGSCGTNVHWKLSYQNTSAVLTISGTGAMEDYTIDTQPWKEHIANIKTVEVCDGVTYVGAYAFCPGNSSTAETSLAKVTLADSVTAIGDSAFCFCTALKTLTLGNGLQTIGDSAFACVGITSLTLPDSLMTVGRYAFQSCDYLKTLTVGSGTKTIGYTAFASCTALETVTLGPNVTTLEQSAFNGCSKLTKLVIPASVTSVGKWVFRNCTKLQYVEFLGNAPTFDSNAFAGASCHAYYLSTKTGWTAAGKLSNYGGTVVWGAISQRGTCGAKAEWLLDTAGKLFICGSGSMYTYSAASNVPWYAYRNSIKRVSIQGVTNIAANAFSGCSALVDVSVSSTVTSVGNNAFADCTSLDVVVFEGDAPNFGASAFSGTTCEVWFQTIWPTSAFSGYGGSLTWRSLTAKGTCGADVIWALDSMGTLVVMGSGAMNNFASSSYQPWYSYSADINAVIIGDSVTSVGSYAFRNCTALQTVTIGDSVTSIGSYAFYGCTGLNTITFLGDAPSFSSYVFNSVTATACYPLTNTTWTSAKLQNYGGTLTWQAVCTRHNETIAPAVAATCTATGLTEGSYCSLCNEVLVPQEVIPAKGHFVLGPDNTEVPADTLAGDCVKAIMCTVCKGVAIEAMGHRILGNVPVEKDPLTISNTSTYPFSLKDGTYYSTNTKHDSSSELKITAQYACSVTLNYGVSSEEDCDELYILVNGSSKKIISGEVADQTMTLTLSAGDVVTVRYRKDESVHEGQNRGWVTLVYDPVMVDSVGDVPADTAEPDCTNAVVCRYCQTVVKEALGHRVIVQLPEPETPYTVTNTSATPFVLTDGTYYSANHGSSSVSNLLVNVKSDCTLTLSYGVSSEATYDKLTILLNGTAKDTISGLVSEKTMTLEVTAGDTVTVSYSKDSSVNKNDDRGWVCVEYSCGPTEQIVQADTVDADCTAGVVCDFCQSVVKEALGHTEVIDEGYAATCTADGLTEGKHCSVCNEVITAQEVIPSLGHTEVIDEGYSATCTADGLTEGKHCSVCGEVFLAQEIIPAGHTVEDGICTSCGMVGTCGDNLTWEYNGGTLTVSGTGAMYDYSQDGSNAAPWKDLADTITGLVLEEGVTEIGDFAFTACSAIDQASFPSTLNRVGEYAFYRLTMPDGNVYHRPFRTEINQTARQWSQVQMEKDNEEFPGWDFVSFVNLAPVVASGKSGNHVYWELKENGNMEFFGNGDMYGFGATGSPYTELSVRTVTVGEGITNIGMNLFEAWGTAPLTQTFESVTIAPTVKRVEEMAFTDCKALKQIVFTGDAPAFGENCFRGVTATANYPAGNSTWTSDVMQNYEGTITWVAVGEEPEIEKIDLSGTAMTLGNSLSMDFAVNVAKLSNNGEGHYALITKHYADGRADVVTRIDREDWALYGGTIYTASCSGIAAKEMCDEVEVVFYNAEGYAVTNTYTDSVKSYAMRTLNNSNNQSKTELLTTIVDMLNYGAAAQQVFGYDTENLANADLTEAQQAMATTEIDPSDARVKGPGYAGSTLTLESQILLDFVFYDSTLGTDLTGMYAIASYTDHYGNAKEIRLDEFKLYASGLHYVSVSGMAVADCSSVVSCTIYNSNGEQIASASDSVEGYIARQLASGRTDTIYTAILKFAASAYNYFH